MLSKHNVGINKRFLETSNMLIENHGIKSIASFARGLDDVHPQFFTDCKKLKLKVSSEVLKKLNLKYPEANIIYILTGNGKAIKSPYQESQLNSQLEDVHEDYAKSLTGKECEKLKLDYLLIQERCEAYENVFKMLNIEYNRFT